MRIWSVLEFIPKALTFEHAEPESIAEETAAMDQAQLWRLSLDVVTSGAMLAAFTAAARTV